MVTQVTRANPSATPPLEDRSKRAQHKKFTKPNKEKIAFAMPNDDDDEGQSSEDEDKVVGPQEQGNNSPQ